MIFPASDLHALHPEPLSRYQIGRYLARAARKHANQRNMATVAGRCEGLRQRACSADFDDVVDTPGQIIGNLTPLRCGFVIYDLDRDSVVEGKSVSVRVV